MSWAKFDDAFWSHPKVVRAGNEAVGAFVRMVCYCSQYLTDGAVPAATAREIARPKVLERLVEVGLLEVDGDGFRVHGYLERNPSRLQVEAERAAKTQRQNRWRESRAQESKTAPNAGNVTRVDASTAPSQDASKDAAPSRPVPTPKNPSPNPLPQAEGGSAVEASPSKPIERLAATSATCSTVEHLGTDPHEVALTLGASVPRLRHFPGGMRDDFRRVASPLRIEWPVLAAWLDAGGTRRHRSGRVTWSWLLGHGGGPLAECWALAQEWASKGRPALDDRGEIAAPKPAPEAKPAPLRVVPAPLAWLEGAPERISPEAIERAKAKALAKVANGR